MSKGTKIWMAGLLACSLSAAWAQDGSAGPTSPTSPTNPMPRKGSETWGTPFPGTPDMGAQSTQEPAYGQDNAPPPITENPPLSGLDMPSLEPHAAPLSYLQPGATVSESADSNAANAPGTGTSFTSITRALGSLQLRRLWSHYDLGLDYLGGVGYFTLDGQGAKLLQQMDLDQRITWKRGQLSLRDSFSYLPEGNFGASYGSLSSVGVTSLNNTAFGSFMGGSILGTLGLAPRIVNVSVADVTENLTPKSAVTASGGYAFTHFYGNDVSTGGPFIGVSQVSAQGGYNRLLTPHTQIALVYGYQAFDFSVSGMAFHTHVIQAMVGKRITGRMDLLVGAGPQITLLQFCQLFMFGSCLGGQTPDTRIGVAGQARLRYKFPKTSLDLSYQRYETSGSGFFAGAQTDLARLTVERPLSRVWTAFTDTGYSRNSRLQSLSPAELATCVYPGQPNPSGLPPCPGVDANMYSYGFAGVGVHRQFGHDFHGFASYQFNELYFDQSYCTPNTLCSRVSNAHVITIGLDWTPRPIRLD